MFAVILVFFVAAVAQFEASEIKCEKFERFDTFKKCCYLNATTVISAVNVTVGGLENSDVDAILFEFNKKIRYLPVNLYKKFPNLETYLAKNASIREISSMNFDRLSGLKVLDLRANQIQTIPNFCFEGLIKLNEILLENNKISTMNGVAFANVPRLVLVNLRNNVCINRFFATDRSPNIFRRKISKNCASTDSRRKEIFCDPSFACDEIMNELFVQAFGRSSGCCKLEYGTYIDSPDYSYIDDKRYNKLEVMYIIHQQNTEFLPILVHERFPILKFYSVVNAPIQKISKKNFEKLFELTSLHMESNQIEVIKSDTFDDLINLKDIMILKQRLISLNGRAFVNLHSLEAVFLNNNYCIDKHFLAAEGKKNDFEAVTKSCGYDEFVSVEIPCEKFQDIETYDFCVMTGQTAINSPNSTIADLRDEEVEGIIFDRNTDIEYLPYKIYLQFPNIYTYKASRCSIKLISKENFEKLNRLKSIELSFNEIQKISGNTFKGLENLLKVDLNANQIKSINGRTFDQIPLLTSVDLRFNDCIDDRLEEGQSIKNFTRKIIQNCAFTETGEREFEKLFDIECGFGMVGTGYIVRGNETKRGQWPFMAALVYEPLNKFFCGGSIITASHVLTAAHCIQDKRADFTLEPHEVLILLGRYNISKTELGSEIRGVKDIQIHPRWNPSVAKFEGDIAVLELNSAVQFSELIQPICLTVEPEISQQEAGYVVGWGKSETSAPHENVPRQVLISSVTADACFERDFRLGEIFAQGMYCAGGDETGPCNGDSGGGFFVRYHGLWTLRGVVSSGSSKADGGCDVGRFSLFSNVVDYTSWINEAINKNATLNTWSPQVNPTAFGLKNNRAGTTEKPVKVSSGNSSGKRIFVRPE